MESICATGIRVSEVRYITVEAARTGVAEVALKGKIRTILLPQKLCRKLLKYAKTQKIVSGELFLTRDGKSLSRKFIWSEMKRLCDRELFQNNAGTVTSLVSREEFFARQSEMFVEDTFNGSLPAFLAAFGSRKKLSDAEIDELQKVIDSMRG